MNCQLKPTTVLARLAIVCCLLCLTLFFGGCEDRQGEATSTPPTMSAEPQAPPPRLLIGLVPEKDIFKQRGRYLPLVKYLSEQSGVTIELKILSRYGNIVSNFTKDRFDGAFLGSFSFALFHKQLGLEPIARPVELDGSSTYHGIIFVRKDSGIRSGLMMKGKRFAFVEQATMAGYLLPLHYFQTEGIADYRSWFGETYFAGSNTNSINDVLNKKADAGATKVSTFNRLAKESPLRAGELLILANSPEIPGHTLAVRGDLDPIIKRKLKTTLLAMSDNPTGKFVLSRFGAREFIETKNQDFQAVYQYAADIGLDLATYTSKNK